MRYEFLGSAVQGDSMGKEEVGKFGRDRNEDVPQGQPRSRSGHQPAESEGNATHWG